MQLLLDVAQGLKLSHMSYRARNLDASLMFEIISPFAFDYLMYSPSG